MSGAAARPFRVPRPVLLPAVLLLALALAGCGERGRPGAAGPSADDPVGRWRLDREALLRDLAALHKEDGPAVVAREQDLGRGVSMDLEIRGDGVYAYRTVALGEQEFCLGTWKRDQQRLLFTPVKRNDTKVEGAEPEEATLEQGRIVVRFAGKTFTLVRSAPE